MIETRQMEIEDFLFIMKLNAHIFPEFDELSDEEKRYVAKINLITGVAKSFFENGRLFSVAGIRYLGIGEAWMISPEEVRKRRAVSLLKETKKAFIKSRDEHNLWRIFAETNISETFLRHLGFKPHPQGYVWTRM